MNMPVGIVFFAHGSSVGSANAAVQVIAGQAAAQGDFALFTTAFLEMAQPDLAAAVEDLAARGASTILVVPYFLTLGIHLQRDLPRMVEEIQARHPGLPIDVAPPLDGHPALSTILVERAKAALA